MARMRRLPASSPAAGQATPASLRFAPPANGRTLSRFFCPDGAAILSYIKEISPHPVLFIHGEKAHSRYFAETAYAAAAEPKELRWYDTGHVLPPQASLDKHDWLHKQIGIDPRPGS